MTNDVVLLTERLANVRGSATYKKELARLDYEALQAERDRLQDQLENAFTREDQAQRSINEKVRELDRLLDAYKEALKALEPCVTMHDTNPEGLRYQSSVWADARAILARAREQGVIE